MNAGQKCAKPNLKCKQTRVVTNWVYNNLKWKQLRMMLPFPNRQQQVQLYAGECIQWCCLFKPYRLNMELNLQRLFGLHAHSCTHWLRTRNPPPPPSPPFGIIYEAARALLVSPDRRHLIVTSWLKPQNTLLVRHYANVYTHVVFIP